MSFGSENPELWDYICKRGIINKLRAQLEKNGFDNVYEEDLTAVVEVLYELPKMQNVLLDWAQDEVCSSEQEFWGDQVDEAVIRHEARRGY